MALPKHKTKIVCTLGPASESEEILQRMLHAGMNVARLNFSHGDPDSHRRAIEALKSASRSTGQRVAIMADLPGPKMRVGRFSSETIELAADDPFVLTTEDVEGDQGRASVSFSGLPRVVKPGDRLYLNDGLIQMEVKTIEGTDVHCRVLVGGELSSRKGLNLPGIDLGIRAFTRQDHLWLEFAKAQGLDAVSQSFVENAADIEAVRRAAADMDYHPFIIAKIERSNALGHVDEILDATDGIMIARGDLGVEIPVEKIAVVQKQLMEKANLKGKPVITATQMLESMTTNRLPTRAESTDVANAILDGTDCVMLSGESAMGKYPVDAVAMLSKIAEATEPHRTYCPVREALKTGRENEPMSLPGLINLSVATTVERISPTAVIVPTRSGYTARNLARFKLPVWIAGVSSRESTRQGLQFSYGVYPVNESEYPGDWSDLARLWLKAHGVEGSIVILNEGPSSKHPDTNNRMEIIDLKRRAKGA